MTEIVVREDQDHEEEEVAERWERVTDEPDSRGVSASRWADALMVEGQWPWQIWVCVAEFVREEPLEGEIRRAVHAALAAVPGVTAVSEEDREAWAVAGAPEGPALVRAVGAAVDAFAERAEAHMEELSRQSASTPASSPGRGAVGLLARIRRLFG